MTSTFNGLRSIGAARAESARIAPDLSSPDDESKFSYIIGSRSGLKKVLDQIEVAAPTDCTIMIHGETGSGKELIAQAVHDLSLRNGMPFVKVNCAAIPSGLMESDLFGHERGAFTGAFASKLGRFELAHKGTLFPDEIGELQTFRSWSDTSSPKARSA